MRLPGVANEAAAAVRRVGAAYERIPEPLRPEIDTDRWHQLEREIDEACAEEDRDGALAAIAAWERHALDELGEAAA